MGNIRKKILLISDHISIPSGVGHMSNLIATHLVKKGFQVVQMGGAVKHPSYDVQTINNIKVIPVDVYGNPDQLRSIMQMESPDIMMLFTDPRYFEWVWNMEDEIRNKMPIFYYHVWDDDPVPLYNEKWYKSCDFIACISKLTYNIVNHFNVPCSYVPHGVDTEIFKPLTDLELIKSTKNRILKNQYDWDDDTFIVFWNNRNIRRKIPQDVMKAFNIFNKEVNNSILVMHTNVVDGEGTDLYAVKKDLFPDTKVVFTDFKIDQPSLNIMYNMVDTTINIAFNEGFGLTTLESMAAGVPIIVLKTGGLQDQVYFSSKITKDNFEEGKEYDCGILLEPDVRTLVGSVPTPYIYDDRVAEKKVVDALMEMYKIGKEGRKRLSLNARENVLQNFTKEQMCEGVEQGINTALNNFKPRKNYDIILL